MDESVVLLEIRPYVYVISLNRPPHNALNQGMLEAFLGILQVLKQKNRGVVLIKSEHPGIFCAGADLKERLKMNEQETQTFVWALGDAFLALENLHLPTIALLNGSAFGGGLELALACDLRLGMEGILLGLPEVSLGIIPGAGGTKRLSRLVGLSRAKEMILLGKPFQASRAYEIGLLNGVESDETRLWNRALDWANTLNQKGPLALKAAKQALKTQADFENERHAYLQVLYSQDRLEGLKAFNEKRSPVFKGE